MAGGLFVDGIDEIERVGGVVALLASARPRWRKNSLQDCPAFALSRLMWPESLGSVDPMRSFASRKRCGVSAWVSMTMAEF